MPSKQKPDKYWLQNLPSEGDEAQWFKEQSQNNRPTKFRLRR